jgi:hypothetical protein
VGSSNIAFREADLEPEGGGAEDLKLTFGAGKLDDDGDDAGGGGGGRGEE